MGQRLGELLNRWLRGRAGKIAGVGGVTALLSWYFGNDALHALQLGVLVAMGVSLSGYLVQVGKRSRRPAKRRPSHGSRNDVAILARSMRGGWGYVRRDAAYRLQELAQQRLAVEGLDLSTRDQRAAIESRIGADLYAVLVNCPTRPPKLKTLIQCLDALDSLPQHDEATSRRP
jgi:hypothetical protein